MAEEPLTRLQAVMAAFDEGGAEALEAELQGMTVEEREAVQAEIAEIVAAAERAVVELKAAFEVLAESIRAAIETVAKNLAKHDP